jgi:hypothetical protein
LTYLAVAKLHINLEDALYNTPVAFLMLMLYEIAWMHDNSMFSLIEKEAIDKKDTPWQRTI